MSTSEVKRRKYGCLEVVDRRRMPQVRVASKCRGRRSSAPNGLASSWTAVKCRSGRRFQWDSVVKLCKLGCVTTSTELPSRAAIRAVSNRERGEAVSACEQPQAGVTSSSGGSSIVKRRKRGCFKSLQLESHQRQSIRGQAPQIRLHPLEGSSARSWDHVIVGQCQAPQGKAASKKIAKRCKCTYLGQLTRSRRALSFKGQAPQVGLHQAPSRGPEGGWMLALLQCPSGRGPLRGLRDKYPRIASRRVRGETNTRFAPYNRARA
ncbi:uncharacterized protein C8Q71DRAFT_339163 [Rhodofomes roseus]|uniref:Uncharacterized protein n=1 Tax=Rhodofomes roseus TaxID=34475 RepID=A0ABQ8KS15_9APHY|nr:uncharacterized protein C8Q71DRAFT_339163 [Rhodofomes roseus]KAH9841585.1 hypothetical protein C8Q71DRAFT_339163 [Rhodofomes roseus]